MRPRPSMHRPLWTPRRVLVAASITAALAACGGGVLALLPFVTPVGGSWDLDGNPATAQDDPVFGESFFIQPRTGEPYLFDSPLQIEGQYRSVAQPCNGLEVADVEGTIDDGDLALALPAAPGTTCLSGIFVDLATFRADDGRVYRNGRVDVQFERGVWVTGDGARTLKFDTPNSVDSASSADIEGCDVTAAPFLPVTGTLQGHVPAAGANAGTPPRIPELRRNGVVLYTNGVMIDGATLEFDMPGGGKVRLRRQPNTTATCS